MSAALTGHTARELVFRLFKAGHSLHPTYLRVLFALAIYGPQPSPKLAIRVGTSGQNLCAAVKHLRQVGLITPLDEADLNRGKAVYALTGSGVDHVQKFEREVATILGDFVDGRESS